MTCPIAILSVSTISSSRCSLMIELTFPSIRHHITHLPQLLRPFYQLRRGLPKRLKTRMLLLLLIEHHLRGRELGEVDLVGHLA